VPAIGSEFNLEVYTQLLVSQLAKQHGMALKDLILLAEGKSKD
jgi:hypothetical protein